MTDQDRLHLRRCVELAEAALEAGDEPFGSVLVTADGRVVAEDRNRVSGGDETRHPEFELARRAAELLTPEERAAATMYTSGEHCVMCAAACGWVGLGRIVFASSTPQLLEWTAGGPAMPVAALRVADVAPGIVVEGPDPELAEQVRALHARR